MLNQEPAFPEPLGNGRERLVSKGLLYFYRKLSPLRFLPDLLRFAPTIPWVSEVAFTADVWDKISGFAGQSTLRRTQCYLSVCFGLDFGVWLSCSSNHGSLVDFNRFVGVFFSVFVFRRSYWNYHVALYQMLQRYNLCTNKQ